MCCSWRWPRFGTLRSWRRRLPRRSACLDATALRLAEARARLACDGTARRCSSLDNFEQVLDAAPLIADLLVIGRRAPRAGHQPCAAPCARRAGVRCGTARVGCRTLDAKSPADLARSPAVRLFVERVRDVQPGLSPHGRERPHRDGDLSTARCAAARPRAGGAVAQSADGRGSAPQAHARCPALDRRPARSPRTPTRRSMRRSPGVINCWPRTSSACSAVSARCRAGFPIEAAAAVLAGGEESSGRERRSAPRSGRP